MENNNQNTETQQNNQLKYNKNRYRLLAIIANLPGLMLLVFLVIGFIDLYRQGPTSDASGVFGFLLLTGVLVLLVIVSLLLNSFLYHHARKSQWWNAYIIASWLFFLPALVDYWVLNSLGSY
ncbi:MAG: hypothetical protein V1838_01260 [Patescibacteria group bacterium]